MVRHQISHKLWQDEVHSFFNRFEQAKYAHTRSVLGVVWTHCDLLGAGTLLPWDLLFLQARFPSREHLQRNLMETSVELKIFWKAALPNMNA